jgi:hypothetical protein
VEEDQHGIIDEMHLLALAHRHILETSNNHSNEHGQRYGIDLIISLALCDRLDRHFKIRCVSFSPLIYPSQHRIRTEEAYCIVNLPPNPDAVFDTLVTIPSDRMDTELECLGTTFEDPTVMDHLFWSSSGSVSPFSIIGFAGEFKKDDAESNKNQLISVLATAQSQRKALSLKKSIVMGATGCRGHVQIYSSYWNDDETVCTYYSSGAESSGLLLVPSCLRTRTNIRSYGPYSSHTPMGLFLKAREASPGHVCPGA